MTTRQELEQAIVVLEAHRDILDVDVVNTALAALQEKIVALQTVSLNEQQQNMAVLVADLSGFTAMSETMDAEEVRDTINAIWQKLDRVIVAWGGKIDQHIGDGVVALFRVTTDLADCKERAVLAALDMQMELALFNREQKVLSDTGPLPRRPPAALGLGMRIGIHSGLVVFGKVGSSDHYSAVGDVIAVTNQLEHVAPVGHILISDDVHNQVQYNFMTEILPPFLLPETNEYVQAHIVLREKHHALQDVDRETAPNDARFVGRSDELTQLQFMLETTLESGTAQVVAVLGDAGVGKSRLRIEFEKLLALQPTPIHIFKGTAEPGLANAPYAAIQRLLANYFDIHRRSSPTVSRAKLIKGVVSVLPDDDEHAEERAHFIGDLLGFDFADSPFLRNFPYGPRRIREYAFQDLAKFFTAVTDHGPAVLFLENMELIDEGSLDFLEYLVHVCAERPLLIIYLARPELLTRWPSSQLHLAFNPLIYNRLDLGPLSPIDNRHLIANRLQNIPRSPRRLTDLLAEAAGGNPFLIIEIIEMLGEVGVIIKSGKQWRVQLGQLSDLRGKLTLDWLLNKQLERLTPIEQAVLKKAAATGPVFWETAVTQFLLTDNPSVTTRQIQSALHNLTQQDLIIQRTTSLFPQTNEYNFWHDLLRRIIYADQPEPERQATHAQCAAWLREQETSHLSTVVAVIAHHLEQAGSVAEAADWYARAATQSTAQFIPETAIRRYVKALKLLPKTADTLAQHIQLNEGLGQALRQQSRFDDAIAAFTEMRDLALQSGDSVAARRAFQHIFFIHTFRGAYRVALEMAKQAEKTARANKAAAELALALSTQGWAYLHLGDSQPALTMGKQALAISTKINAKREMAYSQTLMGAIGLVLRKLDQAQAATEKALALFREIDDRLGEGIICHNLGRIAFIKHDYAKAVTYLKQSTQLARDIGNNHGAMDSLRELSKVAQQQNAFADAESYQKQALIWAEKSGDVPSRIFTTADLGRLHLAQQETAETAVAQGEHLRQARFWLERGRPLIEQTTQSLPRVTLQIEMARLLLAEQAPADALNQIREALVIATADDFLQQGITARKTCAAAWRELGRIAIELPPTDRPIRINNQVYDIAGCFQQSIQILTDVNSGAKLEKARSLFDWAAYELRWGNHQRGENLWRQALTIYTQLGMKQEIAKMEHFAL